jgi:hypothetical protein
MRTSSAGNNHGLRLPSSCQEVLLGGNRICEQYEPCGYQAHQAPTASKTQ